MVYNLDIFSKIGVFCGKKMVSKTNVEMKTLHLYIISQIFLTLYGFRGVATQWNKSLELCSFSCIDVPFCTKKVFFFYKNNSIHHLKCTPCKRNRHYIEGLPLICRVVLNLLPVYNLPQSWTWWDAMYRIIENFIWINAYSIHRSYI